MKDGHPKGTALTWVIGWALQIFLNTADCESLSLSFSIAADCNVNYSSHDFARLCNVESVQDDSLSLVVYLCATGHR